MAIPENTCPALCDLLASSLKLSKIHLSSGIFPLQLKTPQSQKITASRRPPFSAKLKATSTEIPPSSVAEKLSLTLSVKNSPCSQPSLQAISQKKPPGISPFLTLWLPFSPPSSLFSLENSHSLVLSLSSSPSLKFTVQNYSSHGKTPWNPLSSPGTSS